MADNMNNTFEHRSIARWSLQSQSQQSGSQPPATRLPPEILIHAMRQLTIPRDIHSCLLVSRTWCECAVELLWHKPHFIRLPNLFKMIQVLGREDQTFLYASFVKRLNFSNLSGELSDQLFSRLASCTRLERLTLVNCSALSDDAHCRVLPCCPNLVALDLTNVHEVTDVAICALAATAVKLQGINLGGCKKVTDRGILAMAENCRLQIDSRDLCPTLLEDPYPEEMLEVEKNIL